MVTRIVTLLAVAALTSAAPQLSPPLPDDELQHVETMDTRIPSELEALASVVKELEDMGLDDQEILGTLAHDREAEEAVIEVMLSRPRRSYYGCDGANVGSPACQFLRSGAGAGTGSETSGTGQPGGLGGTQSIFISSDFPGRNPEESGPGGRGGSGFPQRPLEPSFSHDRCVPPVQHVIRQAVEYLARTVYNTQHLILPKTRLLTMVETAHYPQPAYVTSTTRLTLPDLAVTNTAVRRELRTTDVNQVRTTDVTLRSTKLHIFTDTKDYFWTKTEYQPFHVTETKYTTLDVSYPVSHEETKVVYETYQVTRTIPHTITATSTVTTSRPEYVTEPAHQYRYVAVTPVPVYVTQTVTACPAYN